MRKKAYNDYIMTFCRITAFLKDVWDLQQRSRNRKKANRRNSSYNRKTLLWLVLFFPVGFGRMLSSACSWHRGVKYAVSCLACALVAAVMIAPSPYVQHQGGIHLYGDENAAEPYGPDLPETIVGGYVAPVIQSVFLPEAEEGEGITYVYATDSQENYHTGTCQFAYASGHKMTVYEAYFLGYTPGRCCDAPAYVPMITATSTPEAVMPEAELPAE